MYIKSYRSLIILDIYSYQNTDHSSKSKYHSTILCHRKCFQDNQISLGKNPFTCVFSFSDALLGIGGLLEKEKEKENCLVTQPTVCGLFQWNKAVITRQVSGLCPQMLNIQTRDQHGYNALILEAWRSRLQSSQTGLKGRAGYITGCLHVPDSIYILPNLIHIKSLKGRQYLQKIKWQFRKVSSFPDVVRGDIGVGSLVLSKSIFCLLEPWGSSMKPDERSPVFWKRNLLPVLAAIPFNSTHTY